MSVSLFITNQKFKYRKRQEDEAMHKNAEELAARHGLPAYKFAAYNYGVPYLFVSREICNAWKQLFVYERHLPTARYPLHITNKSIGLYRRLNRFKSDYTGNDFAFGDDGTLSDFVLVDVTTFEELMFTNPVPRTTRGPLGHLP